MENTQDANAVSSRIRQILDMVSMVKHDERMKVAYVKSSMVKHDERMKVAYVKSFERDELIRTRMQRGSPLESQTGKSQASFGIQS